MAMTDLEFHRDAYKSAFDAEIVAVSAGGAVLLDRTCFYPGGGGQPHDTGLLTAPNWEARVHRVTPGPDGPQHWIDGSAPSVGSVVRGTLDWDRRYALMRTHTALHILCGVIWRDYRRLSTGCNMTPLAAHIDFALDAVDAATVARLESAVNAEVTAARAIVVGVRENVEASALAELLRTQVNLLPEGLTAIRTVEIVGLDLQADGGTHVANTREVGPVRITRYKSKGRENKRLYIEIPERGPSGDPT
jgi:misacylated tRNA(Ala) deacylase